MKKIKINDNQQINPVVARAILESLLGGNRPDDDNELNVISNEIAVFQNHIYFYSALTNASVLRLVNEINKMTREHFGEAASKGKEVEPIHVHVQSDGGWASAGFTAYDYMMKFKEKIPIYTYIEGMAASAATFLTIAGTKRYITPSSTILIHEPRGWIAGSATQITEEYHNLQKIVNIMENIYIKHSKFTKEELKEFLKRDAYLTAEEALERGLVDEINTVFI